METKEGRRQIRFPRVTSVRFAAFDLFKRNENVDIKLEKNVFCLIGANGLGKSSFLNTLIYALTGAIPDRRRQFQSPAEYLKDVAKLGRREDYFSGRLSESVRENAFCSVRLEWPGCILTVTRPIFGDGAVSQLTIDTNSGRENEQISGDSGAEDRFRQLIVQNCGLTAFDQFVFLYHFVCAFDEDRHLLLWDRDALTNALYMAFGTTLDMAQKAARLQREVEKAGSRARNTAFMAKKSADSAEEYEKLLKPASVEAGKDAVDAAREFRRLSTTVDDISERLNRKEMELRQAEATASDASASLTELQVEYDTIFARRTVGSRIASHHPVITATIGTDQCAICGAAEVGAAIKNTLKSDLCPLCDSPISVQPTDAEEIKTLKALDRGIEKARLAVSEALKRRERLSSEVESSRMSLDGANSAIEDFLSEHPGVSRGDVQTDAPNAIKEQINQFKREATAFKEQSQKHYKDRDTYRRQLMKVEREFKDQYTAHSPAFVERFRSFAEEFIGLMIDAQIHHRTGVNDFGFDLLLAMDGKNRMQSTDVSESQRFFLDIALRMALAEYMSATPATLFIDTPEGSLDVAYEARAGTMFSAFAKGDNAIVMTANLRSSELVLRLASLRKYAGMQVERMTDWTDLSEVQQSEEALFDSAYQAISTALE